MKKISARFPEDLLEEIDTLAELEYTDRTTLMKKALKDYIDKELDQGGLRELAVEKYLGGELEYRKLKLLIGREDAEAVRFSKRIMDKGEELAQKLA